MAYLELTNISKTFVETEAVADFNLGVEKGEFVSLLGPSGCGKTTTLRMVAGFETPTAGTIHLDGKDITYTPPNRRNLGMVFQSYALFPNMMVEDNIGFGMQIAKQSKDAVAQRVSEMLGLIHMEKFGDRYPAQLSGGQQQRVALARALAIKPHVLLLDEPLSALDAKIRVELRDEIRRIQQALEITTLYVTHDQEEALSLSDRVVVMSQGHIEQEGTPFEIYNFPATSFVAGFVGTLNQMICSVIDAAKGVVSIDGQSFTLGSAVPSGRSSVPVMLRPEELHLGNTGEENRLKGKVVNVAFLGAIVRLAVQLGSTQVTLDVLNERKLNLPHQGDQVDISFPGHACWLMAES
jgi:putative spermidine/putrescine transport system ATP-binding protein